MAKQMYGYWFICNKCGVKNTTERDQSDKEQIQQECSNCSKTSYYTRPGHRGHHGKNSNLYLEGESAEDLTEPSTVAASPILPQAISTDDLPTKEDFESAYRALTRPGETISIDSVLDQMEINAKKIGLSLKSNWRMVTEQSIEIWSK